MCCFSSSYQPFGQDNGTPTGSETYKFTGKPYSTATGLYYYQRWYDPSIGRFASMDPKQGNPSNPQSLNPYVYVTNLPTLLTDPSGEDGGFGADHRQEQCQKYHNCPSRNGPDPLVSFFTNYIVKPVLQAGQTFLAFENQNLQRTAKQLVDVGTQLWNSYQYVANQYENLVRTVNNYIYQGEKSLVDTLSRIRVTDPALLFRTAITCGVVAIVVTAIVVTDGAILAPLVADPVHGAEAIVGLAVAGFLCYEGLTSGAGLGFS